MGPEGRFRNGRARKRTVCRIFFGKVWAATYIRGHMNTAKPLLISEMLTPASISLNLRGADRDAVLEELVNLVPQLTREPQGRATLLRALQEREMLHSTAVGDGVALPHARNALVGLVDDCIVVFGRHPKGVSFGALDRLPAQIFFLLVAPTVTQHLAILARVSRLVRDAKLRGDLLKATAPEQALRAIRELEEKMQAGLTSPTAGR